MILIPFGVLLGGYTLAFFGWETLKGPGIGLADLFYPSRAAATNAKLAHKPQAKK